MGFWHFQFGQIYIIYVFTLNIFFVYSCNRKIGYSCQSPFLNTTNSDMLHEKKFSLPFYHVLSAEVHLRQLVAEERSERIKEMSSSRRINDVS